MRTYTEKELLKHGDNRFEDGKKHITSSPDTIERIQESEEAFRKLLAEHEEKENQNHAKILEELQKITSWINDNKEAVKVINKTVTWGRTTRAALIWIAGTALAAWGIVEALIKFRSLK